MALIAGALLAVLVAGEVAHRRFGLAPELSRRLDHAAAGPILLGLPLVFDSAWPVVILSAAFAGLLIAARLAGQLTSVHGIRRPSVGAYLYPAAIAATFALGAGQPERYAIAIAALAFADAASGFVGARWPRVPYAAWGQPKSVEGSAAALAVTAIAAAVILGIAGTPMWSALVIAVFTGLVVALVEAALPWGLDNLGVPLAALAALELADAPVPAALLLLAALALCRVATSHGRSHVARTEGSSAANAVAPDVP
jgi:phytol kinase